MSDRPILFSAPMVRALLAGTKTQTRRTAGVPSIEQLPTGLWHVFNRGGGLVGVEEADIGAAAADYLPIQPGDRLWVKETWRTGYGDDWYLERIGRVPAPRDLDPATTAVEYMADGTRELGGKTRVSIHMPKWASRITLHVTEARVQRLWDIDEGDAMCEGAEIMRKVENGVEGVSFRAGYAAIWEAINGPGSWSLNPWVAAYTFEVERCNIAQARAA